MVVFRRNKPFCSILDIQGDDGSHQKNNFGSSVFWSTEHIAYRDLAIRTQTVLENFALSANQAPDAASSPGKVFFCEFSFSGIFMLNILTTQTVTN